MTDFKITTDWLEGDLDDDVERSTFAEVKVEVAQHVLTNVYTALSDAPLGGVRLPASVLAAGIARRWWTLLHEPQRTVERRPRDPRFEARHRLDSLTAGYVFPPVGIWSGGETILANIFTPDMRFQNQRFDLPEAVEPWSLQRGQVEEELGRFIQSTIARARSKNTHSDELLSDWDAIQEASADPEIREWCINAGRLGIDPFDADSPDLAQIAAGLSSQLFGDICEASELPELRRNCDWARSASNRLRSARPISLQGYGSPPLRDLSLPGYRHGYEAADMLRLRLKLPLDPKSAVNRLLNGADAETEARLDDSTSDVLEGVARRYKTEFKAAVPSRSPRQRRFRLCRTAYLAWRVGPDTDVAATPAETWRQQASRSFAAELLAPGRLLCERYGRAGVMSKIMVERQAAEWDCPPITIIRQAQNNGIKTPPAATAEYY